MRVLVTGATGFVGRFLCPLLAERGHDVIAAVRTPPEILIDGLSGLVNVGEIGPETEWTDALDRVDAIIHLAARAHVMDDLSPDPEACYHRTNVEGTICLAQAATRSGIKRFIYLSSVKAMAEESGTDPMTESMPAQPGDAYGRTKLAAEEALQRIATEAGMTYIILRPPLIYGPGAKANFLSLLKACDRRIPLPLASIRNKRSLIYLGNLADALICCLEDSRGAIGTFLVSDGEAVSTPELICRISLALGQAPRLLMFPVPLLRLAGLMTGKAAAISRLTGSLDMDVSEIQKRLGWTPPFNMIQGLERTAEWFLKSGKP